jgi:hypothetical protein
MYRLIKNVKIYTGLISENLLNLQKIKNYERNCR